MSENKPLPWELMDLGYFPYSIGPETTEDQLQQKFAIVPESEARRLAAIDDENTRLKEQLRLANIDSLALEAERNDWQTAAMSNAGLVMLLNERLEKLEIELAKSKS